jgi:hypothetical protein
MPPRPFARESALFDAQLPSLLGSHAGWWFVAWDGELKAIEATLEGAAERIEREAPDKQAMVRQITEEPVRVPIHFFEA